MKQKSPPADSPWTDDKVSELTRLWTDNWSCSRIAKELGMSVGAIVSKRKRIGLPGRPDPARQIKTEGPPAPKLPPLKINTSDPTIPFIEPTPPPKRDYTNGVPTMELRTEHCRWPISSQPYLFCGEPRAVRCFCAKHAKIAYPTLAGTMKKAV
jgi:GcrA cell cycle regulator